MEIVDAHQEQVVVGVDEFYHLLHASVDFSADKSAEASYSVVDVYHIVARLDLSQLF